MRYRLLTISLFFISFCSSNISSAQVFNVRDFGAKGDGLSDDYLPILNAVNALNKNGKGTILFPKGAYYIASFNSQGSNFSDIEFKNLTKLEIVGSGSKIILNAKFHRKADQTKGKYKYSQTKTIVPFSISNCKEVTIRDLEIDGGANFTTRENEIVESGGRLLVFSNSHNIVLKNLKICHALSDGIYVANNTSNLTGENVQSLNNARQGISIISGNLIRFENSKFNGNGNTEGEYIGHSPMAGIDIEPGDSTKKVANVYFNKCEVQNNLGSQVIITKPGWSSGIKIENSIIDAKSSLGKYQLILAATNVTVNNNEINCGTGNLYATWNEHPNSELYLTNNRIKGQSAGIMAVTKLKDAKIIIDNNVIEFTGDTVSKYFPYIVADITFTNNKIIIPKLKNGGINSLIKVKKLENNSFTSDKGKFKPNVIN